MNQPSPLKFLLVALLCWALTACGGGGAGSLGGVSPDSGAATDAVATIVLTLVDAAGNAVTEVNGTDQTTARVVVRNSAGNVVSGNLVTFSVSAVGVLGGNSAAVTDSNGVATLALTAGTVSGAGTLTASTSVLEDGVSTNIASNELAFSTDGQGSTTDPVNLNVVLTLTPMTLSRANPGTITLTLSDDEGNPVVGAIVTFSSSSGALSATAVFTDANGIASTSLTAGTISGVASLDATVIFGNETVDADTVPYITDGDAFTTMTLALTTATVSSAVPATVTATITGSDGSLLQDVLVTFALSGAVGILNTTVDRTNASGQASVVLSAGTRAGFGDVSAQATVAGASLAADPQGFQSSGDGPFAGEGSSNLSIVIALVDGSGNAIDPPNIDADNPGILQARVIDAQGAGIENMVVLFAADLGDLFPANGFALTNSDGVASVSLTAGSTPGAGAANAAIVIDGQTFDSDSLTFSSLGNAGDTVIVLTLTFADATPGNASNIITLSDAGTLTILVEDAAAVNLPNRSVTITTTLGTLGAGAAATVIALSDSDGKVSLSVNAGASIGTGDIVVTVGDTTETIQFDVGVDGLQIGSLAGIVFTEGSMTISPDTISAEGTATITVTVVDQSETPIPGIEVSFTTTCAEGTDPDTGEALASITAKVTTDDDLALLGQASATYQAGAGCEGGDVITATEINSGADATGTITVNAPEIGSIKFDTVVVDADDLTLTSIQIKESGGIDRGEVIFQVLDVRGDPAEGRTVNFELTTNVGGLALQNDEGLTNELGKVSAIVVAGFIPTTVRVRASVVTEDDITLVTLSELLTVNTGIPDQNSMSISATVQNIEGNGLDGLTTSITVRMSDAFENPVADGTAVTFRTELASIQPECTTTAGACAVLLTTGDPRTPLTGVSFRTLADRCPNEKITDERVTISGSAGETNYRMDINATIVVQTLADVFLTKGVAADYNVDKDGGGITCVAGSASCTAGTTLKVTYNRLWLDEDPYDIVAEPILIASGVGATVQTVDTDTTVVVVDALGTSLVEGVDYSVGATGITCIGTSTECIDAAALTISYDQISATDKLHIISNPGVATLPFTNVTGVPCRAAARAATGTASAYNFGLGQPYGGRSTVLAYALGEESFIDSNGNGQYDFEEPFVDLPEAFLDKNEDAVFGNGDPTIDDSRNLANPSCYGPVAPISNPGEIPNVCYQNGGEEETFIDFGDAVSLNYQFDQGNQIYNGTLCPKAISDRTISCDTLPCDEATERYCTRDLVNIRREIDILLSGSTAFFGRRDGNAGELVSSFDITTGDSLSFNEYTATTTVTANNGALLAPGTEFTIGDANSATEVSPGIGELVTLTSGSSFIVIGIADIYNGFLPATATISAVSGTDGCVIQNSPGGVVGNTGSLGFTQIGISVAPPTLPLTGGAPITITVTTADGPTVSQTSVSCVY